MKSKMRKCLVITSTALLLARCGSGAKKQTSEEVNMDSVKPPPGFKTLQ